MSENVLIQMKSRKNKMRCNNSQNQMNFSRLSCFGLNVGTESMTSSPEFIEGGLHPNLRLLCDDFLIRLLRCHILSMLLKVAL